MFVTYAISLLLIGLSGLLIDSHRRSWRSALQDDSMPERERRYCRAQYRRRMQASGIIGALGAAIGVRSLVPHEPWPMILYLVFLSGACLSIMLLAGLDAWATRQHYARIRTEQLTAEIKLARELARARQSSDLDK
jgi:hypothetical protein